MRLSIRLRINVLIGMRLCIYAAEALRRLERFLSKSCIDVLAKVNVRPYGNGCPMGIVKQQRTDEVLSVMRVFGKPLFQPLKSRYGTERSLRRKAVYPAAERPPHQNQRKRAAGTGDFSVIKIEGIECGFNQLRFKTVPGNVFKAGKDKAFKLPFRTFINIRKAERKADVFQVCLSTVVRINILGEGAVEQFLLQGRSVMSQQQLFQKHTVHQPVDVGAFGQQPIHRYRELVGIFSFSCRRRCRKYAGCWIGRNSRNERRLFRRFKKPQEAFLQKGKLFFGFDVTVQKDLAVYRMIVFFMEGAKVLIAELDDIGWKAA